MAKKDFKSGLGSLIRDSRVENQENNIDEDIHENSINLINKIDDLNAELRLWRTGKLTTQIFENNLKSNNLAYNQKDNSFKKI
ncbi:MAG: hypothetical protein JXA16_12725 [Bacteroidales bacterium]|nr:hypothetical protein [Bacteroidales bacterium]